MSVCSCFAYLCGYDCCSSYCGCFALICGWFCGYFLSGIVLASLSILSLVVLQLCVFSMSLVISYICSCFFLCQFSSPQVESDVALLN